MFRIQKFVVCAGFLLVAIPLLSQSVETGTDRLFANAVRLQRSGDYESAIGDYRRVIEADPSRYDARSNLGAILSKLGNYQAAIEQYREAMKNAPQEAQGPLQVNLALAYYKSAQIPVAAKLFTKLHGEYPDNLNATLLLADCDLRMGSFKPVIDLLLPIEPSQPDNKALTYMLGLALIRAGQVTAGQRRIEKLMGSGDTAETRFLLGSVAFAAHDYPGAVKAFAHAIQAGPELPGLQSYYGQALLETGDGDGAAAAFRKELASNPNDFEANLLLGQILERRQKKEEAKPYLERAALLRPGARLSGPANGEGKSTGVPVGTQAPHIAPLELDRFAHRMPVVLVFGSYTCPQLRGSAGAIQSLYEKYKGRVEFELVYIKEAHGAGQWQSTINEREGIRLEPAQDLEEKRQHAAMCVRNLHFTFPSKVDGMDGKVEAAYDAWPSRLYVIAKDGRVTYSTRLGEQDFDPAQLETAVRSAL